MAFSKEDKATYDELAPSLQLFINRSYVYDNNGNNIVDTYAPKNSPVLTGVPRGVTVTTPYDSTNRLATTKFVHTALAKLSEEAWFGNMFAFYKNSVKYSTNGTYTWTCPSNIKTVVITVVGAGGGGAGYSKRTYTVNETNPSDLNNKYTITPGSAGTNGGTTTVTIGSTTYTANGGTGASASADGANGTPTKVLKNTTGGFGGNGEYTGGNGGVIYDEFIDITPGSTITIKIGKGGTGGAGATSAQASGSNGTDGYVEIKYNGLIDYLTNYFMRSDIVTKNKADVTINHDLIVGGQATIHATEDSTGFTQDQSDNSNKLATTAFVQGMEGKLVDLIKKYMQFMAMSADSKEFYSSGEWTCPMNVTSIKVTACAGGGGGSGWYKTTSYTTGGGKGSDVTTHYSTSYGNSGGSGSATTIKVKSTGSAILSLSGGGGGSYSGSNGSNGSPYVGVVSNYGRGGSGYGNGGNGGSVTDKEITVTPGEVYQITIGSAGSGGTGPGGNGSSGTAGYIRISYGSSVEYFESDYVSKKGDTITGNLTIKGNLNVVGTSTTFNSTDTKLKDNIITLNNGETGSGVSAGTAGLEISRGTSSKYNILFNETNDYLMAGLDGDLLVLPRSEAAKGSSTRFVYVSNGVVQQSMANVGSNTQAVYLSSGSVTAQTFSKGDTSTPIYYENGEPKVCGNVLSKSGGSITGNLSISGTATVGSTLTANGDLSVAGSTTTKAITANGNVSISGTTTTQAITASGAITANSNLSVAGTTTTKSITANGNVSVSGTTTTDKLTVSSELNIPGGSIWIE